MRHDIELLSVRNLGASTERNLWIVETLPFEEDCAAVLAAWRRQGMAAGHSERTISSRTYTVRRLIACGVNPLTADRDDLIDWLSALCDSRTGAPAKRSSKATYRAQLRAFYAFLVESGRRQDDPTDRLPSPKPGRNVPRPASPAQVRAILAACGDVRARQTRAYVILAAYAGLRVHEIAQIRGEDFDETQIHVTGKGGDGSSVPMHPSIAALVETMPRKGWWFPTDSASGHVHRCSVSSAIKRAMVRAEVPGTPHSLRHHYGTQVLRASGGDLRTTQRAMRHATPATTAIYTQVADESLFRAIAGIPA